MSVRTVQLLDFEADANAGFVDWITRNDCSVVLSHSNKLLACGRDARDEVVVEHVLFDRVTGLSVGSDGTMWVASQHELWSMTNGLGPGDFSPTGADRWMMCRTARFVGGVRPADLAPIGTAHY